jgi:hypothetical protein
MVSTADREDFAERALATWHRFRRDPSAEYDEPGDVPVLTLRDVQAGRTPSGRTDDGSGHVLLQNNDVVAPATARGAAPRVVTHMEEGAALGPHLYLVRADPEHFAPEFVAGFPHIAARAVAARGSSASNRVDVRRARLPRLPLDEQRRYGEAFTGLAEFESALRKVSETGHELLGLSLDGLGDGALRP